MFLATNPLLVLREFLILLLTDLILNEGIAMLSKNNTKLITSLRKKKARWQEGLFIAEGPKLVLDLVAAGLNCHSMYAQPDWLDQHPLNCKQEALNEKELNSISALSTPQAVLAIFEIPKPTLEVQNLKGTFSLYLDAIQDPGNLGTIIRLANWFGIKNLICSIGTADVYNPKVIQATMGAIAGVQVHYVEPSAFFNEYQQLGQAVYGAYMDGESIYNSELQQASLLVVGNEGQGISEELNRFIKHRISLPNYNAQTAVDSLNVAMATGIICAEFLRPQ